MAKTDERDGDVDQVLKELDLIKRLLIVGLAREGVTQEQLAVALRVTQSTVSKMFPGGLPKPPKPLAREK